LFDLKHVQTEVADELNRSETTIRWRSADCYIQIGVSKGAV